MRVNYLTMDILLDVQIIKYRYTHAHTISLSHSLQVSHTHTISFTFFLSLSLSLSLAHDLLTPHVYHINPINHASRHGVSRSLLAKQLHHLFWACSNQEELQPWPSLQLPHPLTLLSTLLCWLTTNWLCRALSLSSHRTCAVYRERYVGSVCVYSANACC